MQDRQASWNIFIIVKIKNINIYNKIDEDVPHWLLINDIMAVCRLIMRFN